MNIKKGFTLVEIIVSLTILSIISMSFLTFLSRHYSFIASSKKVTKETYLMQAQIEEEIEILKEKIRTEGITATPKKIKILNSVFSGGIDVNYAIIDKSVANKTYFTLVSDVKPDIAIPMELENIDIKMYKNTRTSSKPEMLYAYPGSFAGGFFSIEGVYSNKTKHRSDHFLNIVEWYVADEKFVIPMTGNTVVPQDSVEEPLYYYYYPKFPDDYTLVSNTSESGFKTNSRFTFQELDRYAGRHVVFTVTPADKLGKIGIQGVASTAQTPPIAKSVFVSGLTHINNIVAHFDANYIDIYDNNYVDKSTNKLKRWGDLSYILSSNSKTFINSKLATPFNTSLGTSITYTNTSMINTFVRRSDASTGDKWQYVSFGNNQAYRLTNQGTSGKKIYVFAVARKKDSSLDGIFFRNGNKQIIIPPNETTTEWFMIKEALNSTDNNIIVGGTNIEMAELIVYKDDMTYEEQEKVQKYLINKYNNPNVIGEIEKLYDETHTISEGTYVLPERVNAKTLRGYDIPVYVTWDTPSVTAVSGEVYTFTGTSLLDNTKTMTYTVTVN